MSDHGLVSGLAAAWTAPARRRSLLSDALLAAPVLIVVVVLIWRIAGYAPAVVGLALGAGAAAGALRRRAGRFDRSWLVGRLDAHRPDMEDSADLLFAVPEGLGPLQRLQRARLADRLAAGAPEDLLPAWRRRSIAGTWIVAILALVAVLAWPRSADGPVTLSPSREGPATVAGAPVLVGQNLRIRPPAYTGLPVRDEARLDARAPQGSRLEWTLKFAPQALAPEVMTLGGAAIPLRREGEVWVASRTLDAGFLYRVHPVAEGRAGEGPVPPLHRIDAVPDAPPQVKPVVSVPGPIPVTPAQRSWSPAFVATDDYGVAATARLRVTLAVGEGENVVFSEREIAVTGSGPARQRRFIPRLDFAALGFGPGGDLVVQLIVRDNRSPNPQEVRGPSLILRWPSPNQAESSGLEGMVNTTLPAYFRSQRQVIIDAEALIRQRRRLGDDQYLDRSTVIGNDQEILRARYSQFLGGEESEAARLPTSDREAAEVHSDDDGHDHGGAASPPAPGFGRAEDVLAAFGHPHDESPASSLDPETRALLKRAVDAMWLSERELKQGRPDLALPHANEALRFIKEVQQATRIFLSRVGLQLPPIDPARRMTGKREGLESRVLPVAPVASADGPAAAAWRALGQGPGGIRGPIALDGLTGWVNANAARLPDPMSLTAAIDAVERDPRCTACRLRLRGLLWTAMQRPPAQVVRRPAADAAGARYLGAVAGGAP